MPKAPLTLSEVLRTRRASLETSSSNNTPHPDESQTPLQTPDSNVAAPPTDSDDAHPESLADATTTPPMPALYYLTRLQQLERLVRRQLAFVDLTDWPLVAATSREMLRLLRQDTVKSPDVGLYFWSRVTTVGPHKLWQGALRSETGPGVLKWHGKITTAPRVAWELTNGELPAGKYLKRNPDCEYVRCCAPGCFYIVTEPRGRVKRTYRDELGRPLCKNGHVLPKEPVPGRTTYCPTCYRYDKYTGEEQRAIRRRMEAGQTQQATGGAYDAPPPPVLPERTADEDALIAEFFGSDA